MHAFVTVSVPHILVSVCSFQIIIDECAMCTEPETLIPLVGFSSGINKVNKVILIGDHKQLQPIVMCKEVKQALLNKSLFERYAEADGEKDVIMLTEQYRMVNITNNYTMLIVF
jgi:superfamily I DNA and/or RNA helicase